MTSLTFIFENDIELDGDTIGSLFALDIPEEGDEIPNPDVNDPGTNIFKVCIYEAIGVAPLVDLDLKYDVFIYIKRNDDFFGPYTIDPKIRIKSRN